MIKRNYYSVRTGKNTPEQKITFEILKKLFLISYRKLDNEGYFQKYFGKDCVDGFQQGELGADIDAIMYVNLRKENLYPIYSKVESYSEEDFFDVLEFLHDHCSKGLKSTYHSWGDCGYHFSEFNDIEGQKYFREIINSIIKDFNEGYEISENGEILVLADSGLSNLMEADIPSSDIENITKRINLAIVKFRRYKSTLDDRKEAIRELADVLEFTRKDIRKFLGRKDDNDIFNIANNFAIRHHNIDQKTDYNKAIWYSWMFYFYLATLHAIIRIKEPK